MTSCPLHARAGLASLVARNIILQKGQWPPDSQVLLKPQAQAGTSLPQQMAPASLGQLPRASSAAAPPQQLGFAQAQQQQQQSYAQQLQNHLLLQQGGAFPFPAAWCACSCPSTALINL